MIYLQCVKLYGFNYRNVTSTTGLITFVYEPRKGLYVHIILSDTRFGVGLGPLAELLLTLGEVLDMLRAPKVRVELRLY